MQDQLNQRIWQGITLLPEVQQRLLAIANRFWLSLDIAEEPTDIILTGSMAGYNWTPASDIDLHVVFDFNALGADQRMIKNYMLAKKALWNDQHHIFVKGQPVELYAQDAAEPHYAPGIYSLLHNEWVKLPVKSTPVIDTATVNKKAEQLMFDIDQAVAGADVEKLEVISNKLRQQRSEGLSVGGEYSVGNQVFKALRKSGHLEKLAKAKLEITDNKLSLSCKQSNNGVTMAQPNLMTDAALLRFCGVVKNADGEAAAPVASTRMQVVYDVLENGIYNDKGKLKKLEGSALDAYTASAMKTVYEALSPAGQAKFDTIPLDRLLSFVWKAISAGKKVADRIPAKVPLNYTMNKLADPVEREMGIGADDDLKGRESTTHEEQEIKMNQNIKSEEAAVMAAINNIGKVATRKSSEEMAVMAAINNLGKTAAEGDAPSEEGMPVGYDADTVQTEMASVLDIPVDDIAVNEDSDGSFDVSVGSKTWRVFEDEDAAEAVALERVTDMLNNEPEMFTQSWLQNYMTMSDTDRRILAGEESDNRYSDMGDSELEEAYAREVDSELPVDDADGVSDLEMQISTAEGILANEQDPETIETLTAQLEELQSDLETAKTTYNYDTMREKLTEKAYDEVYEALADPVQYFVHDQGIYTEADFLKSGLVSLDVSDAADAAISEDGWVHFMSSYDGNYDTTPSGFVYFREN